MLSHTSTGNCHEYLDSFSLVSALPPERQSLVVSRPHAFVVDVDDRRRDALRFEIARALALRFSTSQHTTHTVMRVRQSTDHLAFTRASVVTTVDEPEALNHAGVECRGVTPERVAHGAQHLPEHDRTRLVIHRLQARHRTDAACLFALADLQSLRFDCTPDVCLTLSFSGARDVKLFKRVDRTSIIATQKDLGHLCIAQVFIDFAVDAIVTKATRTQRPDAMLPVEHPIHAITRVDDRDPELVEIEIRCILFRLGFTEPALCDPRRRDFHLSEINRPNLRRASLLHVLLLLLFLAAAHGVVSF